MEIEQWVKTIRTTKLINGRAELHLSAGHTKILGYNNDDNNANDDNNNNNNENFRQNPSKTGFSFKYKSHCSALSRHSSVNSKQLQTS